MTDTPQQDEEGVLLVARKHWAGFLPEIIFVAIPIVLLAAFWYLSSAGGPVLYALFTLLLPLCLLIVWILLAMLWTNYFLDILVITDRHVFYAAQTNLVSRTIAEWDIHDIRHIGIRLGNVLESLFNYGAVEMNVRGENKPVVFESVPNPEYISAIILKQDDRYGELKKTAREQRELLHFISHEVKGHLTRSKAAFAGIVEGDYGPVSAPLDTMAHAALEDSQKGVETVMSVLDNPNAQHPGQHGIPALDKKPFDLSQTVRRSVDSFRAAAAGKGLVLDATIDDFCAMVGDEKKIEQHVIRNLLDNAIHYTHAGRIGVSLKKEGKSAILSVTDTGVGIAAPDMQRLFTEGGHGEHSKEVNPESTGFGLFIAKQITEAHGGHIKADSKGPGTGSTFSVEFQLG